jgi:phosphoribulokinase
MPFDGLLAECEAQSVPGVFLSVQALKHPEDALLKCGLYAGTVVRD